MIFSCSTKELSSACQAVSKAVTTRSDIPALTGIKIDADGAYVTLCGYNLELGITTTIPASVQEPGGIVIDAKMLCQMIKRSPESITKISVDSKSMATVQSGTSRFDIVGIPVSEYPELPAVEEKSSIDISQPILRSMIQQTAYAVATNDYKPIFTGVLFEASGGKLVAVGTDGYRLAICKEPINYTGTDFNFVVPAKALSEISKLLSADSDDVVHISVASRGARFSIGAYMVFARLLEGEFLDYKAVLPKQCTTSLKVNVKDFLGSVQRVSLLIDDKVRSPLTCDFSGADSAIKLSSNTAVGKASDSVSAEISGEDVHIGFNNMFLIDALSHTDCDEVRLQLNGPLNPMVITPDDGDSSLFLVLPVRLKSGE